MGGVSFVKFLLSGPGAGIVREKKKVEKSVVVEKRGNHVTRFRATASQEKNVRAAHTRTRDELFIQSGTTKKLTNPWLSKSGETT